MSHLRSFSRIFVLIAHAWLVTVPSTTLAAERQAPAAITGHVADETGGMLPGATIVLRHSTTRRERVVVTDGNGRFSADQLVPGSYGLTVTLSGFETLARETVEVVGAEQTRLTLVLRVSAMQDSVVVRGTALNYASSVAGKRAADGVVDMFNADEIGRLPDKNIGETLNRIPGVSMLLEKGEGRFVQIRGISPRLNHVTINGMALGNGETESGGRLAPLDVIGGELLSGVQVIKTPTPDMDGQGIGGTLNLTTKQPFDFAKHFTALVSTRGGLESIAGVSPDDTKEVPYTMDATLTGKVANGKIGWLAGSSFSNRRTPLLGTYLDDWRPVTFGGATISYPTNVKNNVTVTARERLNLNGALEFRPNASSRFFARSFFARWDELQLRNRFDEGLGTALTSVDGTNGGVIAANRVQVNLRSEPTLKKLASVALGGGHRIGRWSLDYVGQRNDNSVHEPNDNWEFRSGTSTFGPDTFRLHDNGAVTIVSAGRDRQDPALQTFRRLRYFDQLTNEKGYAGTVDLRRDALFAGSKPGFLKVGAKATRTKRNTAVSQSTYGIGSFNWTAAESAALTRGGFTNPVPLQSVPNLWLDLDGLNAFFRANRDNPRYFVRDENDSYLNDHQNDFSLRERVLAAYVMGKVDFGPVVVIAGARVENTDVVSSAFTIVTQGSRLVARPIDGGGSYTNVLPSVIGTFPLRRNLIARAAWTSAVGRPEFNAIAPRSRLGIEDNPSIGTIGSLSIGNPDLEARQSNNLDLSLEWYFDEGSLLSMALFRKDITNEIIPAPTQRLTNHTFQEQAFDRFDINTTINAQQADIRGIELTLADQMDFLPSPLNGLGFAASVTLIDSGIEVARGDEVLTLPLLQQADQSTSLTLYYQKGRWDLSGTYKYNSNFLTDYGESRALDLDQGGFGRFDFRAQYDLRPNIKLNFSGINLNDEPTTEFQGGIQRQITEYEYTGRTFFFGISAGLGR
ncbi:MAG TPA: TonB-dependent receptor [Vicinamibacterales bacterium]|nr:TonB-dependent receptor [Vicinamibacterales bacterium]